MFHFQRIALTLALQHSSCMVRRAPHVIRTVTSKILQYKRDSEHHLGVVSQRGEMSGNLDAISEKSTTYGPEAPIA